MNYATIKNNDIANGPGVRVSLFVSGCTHRCPGCFNEIAWDFNYGEPFTEETIEKILAMMAPAHLPPLKTIQKSTVQFFSTSTTNGTYIRQPKFLKQPLKLRTGVDLTRQLMEIPLSTSTMCASFLLQMRQQSSSG